MSEEKIEPATPPKAKNAKGGSKNAKAATAPKAATAAAEAESDTDDATDDEDEGEDTAPAGQRPEMPVEARPKVKGKIPNAADATIDPSKSPMAAMARKIWDSQEKVEIFVPAVNKNAKHKPDIVILAEINGVQWHGIPGRKHLVPAEVARIAIQAGKAQGEMHPDYADKLEPTGEIVLIAEHPDPDFVDPSKQ